MNDDHDVPCLELIAGRIISSKQSLTSLKQMEGCLFPMFIILTQILACILFAPPSLLLFIIFNCFFTLVFYHDCTFHYRQLRFCMTMCMCIQYVHTAISRVSITKSAYNGPCALSLFYLTHTGSRGIAAPAAVVRFFT